MKPTCQPSSVPSKQLVVRRPSSRPSNQPSRKPTAQPSTQPRRRPTSADEDAFFSTDAEAVLSNCPTHSLSEPRSNNSAASLSDKAAVESTHETTREEALSSTTHAAHFATFPPTTNQEPNNESEQPARLATISLPNHSNHLSSDHPAESRTYRPTILAARSSTEQTASDLPDGSTFSATLRQAHEASEHSTVILSFDSAHRDIRLRVSQHGPQPDSRREDRLASRPSSRGEVPLGSPVLDPPGRPLPFPAPAHSLDSAVQAADS